MTVYSDDELPVIPMLSTDGRRRSDVGTVFANVVDVWPNLCVLVLAVTCFAVLLTFFCFDVGGSCSMDCALTFRCWTSAVLVRLLDLDDLGFASVIVISGTPFIWTSDSATRTVFLVFFFRLRCQPRSTMNIGCDGNRIASAIPLPVRKTLSPALEIFRVSRRLAFLELYDQKELYGW